MAETTVRLSHSVQITTTPRSSDISKICAMRKKKQVSLAWFKLGESSLVSERVQSGSHSSAGLLTLLVSVIWSRGGNKREKALHKSSMQCSSDYRPCVCTRRGKKENNRGMGNDGLYLSVNFVQISSTVLKTLASLLVLEDIPRNCEKQTFAHPDKNEQPFPYMCQGVRHSSSSSSSLTHKPPHLHLFLLSHWDG